MMPLVSGIILAVSDSLAASVVAKVTITATLGLVSTWLARGSRAAVRHALLAAMFGVILLLPIASFVMPPLKFGMPVGVDSRVASHPLLTGVAANPSVTTDAEVRATPATPQAPALSPSGLLLAVWISGTVLFLLPVMVGLWQIRSLRRSGLPWRRGQSVVEAFSLEAGIHRRVEVLLHEALPGPMTCGVVHSVVVLPRDAENWNQEELNRAVVHELEHVRRGDSVSRCLARAACAVYWFHPLVWVAWRKLVLEAERSCDDAVLRESEATAYADQLVGLAKRMSAVQGLPLLAMANRADLATRVAAVLDARQRRGRAGAFSLVLACIAAVVLVFVMSPLTVVAAPQTQSATPQFDVVSVKLVDPNVRGEHSHEKSDPRHLTMTGTMHRFIVRAYGITDRQLGGEPDWFATRLYSVEAVTSAPASEDQMMLMLRAALADRFQLKLREESRDVPVFALEVSGVGPKFKELRPGDVQRDEHAPEGIYAKSFPSVKVLTNALNGVFGGIVTLDRTVVDRTQLTGNYDIHLRTEMETQTDDFGRRTSQLPNLSHDIQVQLGLKLVPARTRMPYFVIEKAAAPTPN